MAIGRIERALSKLEQASIPINSASGTDHDLVSKHEKLKSETRAVIQDIDRLIAQSGAA